MSASYNYDMIWNVICIAPFDQKKIQSAIKRRKRKIGKQEEKKEETKNDQLLFFERNQIGDASVCSREIILEIWSWREDNEIYIKHALYNVKIKFELEDKCIINLIFSLVAKTLITFFESVIFFYALSFPSPLPLPVTNRSS